MSKTAIATVLAASLFGFSLSPSGWAQEKSAVRDAENFDTSTYFDSKTGKPLPPKLPPPEGAKAFPKPDVVWIDTKEKKVYVDGYVSLREGLLEMFACPVGTKEHESVVAVFSRAQTIHAALLAVGAEVGHPASFRPKFRPASGAEIEIEVRWQDAEKKWRSTRAQQWVRDIQTDDPTLGIRWQRILERRRDRSGILPG